MEPQRTNAALAATRQCTLARPASFAGRGLFAGDYAAVCLRPAPADHGRIFARTDLPGAPRIPARIACRIAKSRRTALRGPSGAEVEMTEHVLAALAGLGIDNCLIEIAGRELPALDGSALPIVEAILQAGVEELAAPRRTLAVAAATCVRMDAADLAAYPGFPGTLTLDYELVADELPGVGRQRLAVRLDPELFALEIAPARTFVAEVEVAALRAQGIGLAMAPRDNLLMFGGAGRPVDTELRFRDECVRHKLLDLIGDLALLDRPLSGRIVARRSGHAANAALVLALANGADGAMAAAA